MKIRIIKEHLDDRVHGGPEGGDPEWRVEIPRDPVELRRFLDGIAKSIEKMSDEELAAANEARAFSMIGSIIVNVDPSHDPEYR